MSITLNSDATPLQRALEDREAATALADAVWRSTLMNTAEVIREDLESGTLWDNAVAVEFATGAVFAAMAGPTNTDELLDALAETEAQHVAEQQAAA